MKKGRRFTFDFIEVLMILVGVAFVSARIGQVREGARLAPFLSSESFVELQELQQRYGGERNSQHGEEWIIRDFFQDQRGGVFVDVGANDYKRFSNTYYLETTLGWSGVAIEPQTKFAADYAKHRPATTFVPLFVSDVSNREAVLHVPSDDLLASSDESFAAPVGASEPIRATTTTLDDVLDRLHITRVDFLSMDIELAEPLALKGFSIRRFQPRLVGIEGHRQVRQQILDYFAGAGYVLLGKYLRADGENLWFAAAQPTRGHLESLR